MTEESAALASGASLVRQLGAARPCACGCGRTAQREKPFAWLCDPGVPAELKRKALASGGKRKALPAGVADPVFGTSERRQAFREAVAGAVLRDELAPALATVALRAVDGATKDAELERQRGGSEIKPIVVEVQKFGNGDDTP